MKINNPCKFDCEKCQFRILSTKMIGDKAFEEIRKLSHSLHFKKGETILKQGAKTTHVLFLHRGIVKFNYEHDNGKNFILTIEAGPKILGGANLVFGETNMFSLVAVEDADICFIDNGKILESLSGHGNYMLMMVKYISEMFQSSMFNFISLAHKQVNGRIADILLYLSGNVYKSTSFRLSLTRKEIAEYAACSHENVIHTFSKLNKEGVISLDGKNLTINSVGKLREISKHG